MKDELEVKQFPLEIRADGPEAEGIVKGYASTYVRDAYGDRIAPGAFAQSIAEKRSKYPVLFGHEPTALIGFTTHMAEDHKGLLMESKLALNTTAGRDAFALIKVAESVDFLMGLSIGFTTEEFEMDSDVRVLTRINLMEVSVTAFPANRLARVTDARSIRSRTVPNVSHDVEQELRAAILASRVRLIR